MTDTLTLSPGQETALAALHAFARSKSSSVGVLVGPAGTGKTTLLGIFASQLRRDVRFAAPTGRAAKVLTNKLLRAGAGKTASTIHRALYGAPTEAEDGSLDFGEPQTPVQKGGLLIVDEASMIDQHIDRDIRSKLPDGASLLYVGDREQLPPISGGWGPDFASPTVALTEVHRQALESPIVRIATDLRTGGKLPRESDGAYRWRASANHHVAAWMASRREADAVVLVTTNSTRKEINRLVRKVLGFQRQVEPGDRLVVLLNNYELDLMNGELIDVVSASPAGDVVEVVTKCGRTVSVVPSLLGAPVRDFRDAATAGAVHVDHGWALTVHKSQGSEWAEVAVVVDHGLENWHRRDPETARRLLYTAVTRARESLDVLDTRRQA